MNNLYWNGIRSFLAVADKGSFTAAAEVTGLSKSSISQQVSALEKSLGVQLLHRTTRTLRLTDAGRGYQQLCHEGMNKLEIAREWVLQANQSLEGEIRVNAVGGLIGEELIAPLIIEFQNHYPKVDINLSFSSHRVDIMNDEYDLVMRMGDLPDSTLIVRRLHSITNRYVASPNFIAKHGEVLHPNNLAELPVVCGSVTDWLFIKQNERVKLHIKKSFKVASGRVMLQAAEAGLGVARLTDVYVHQSIKQGNLIEVLPDWNQTTVLSLVCPPAKYQLQRVKALMDWLVDRFESRYIKLLK